MTMIRRDSDSQSAVNPATCLPLVDARGTRVAVSCALLALHAAVRELESLGHLADRAKAHAAINSVAEALGTPPRVCEELAHALALRICDDVARIVPEETAPMADGSADREPVLQKVKQASPVEVQGFPRDSGDETIEGMPIKDVVYVIQFTKKETTKVPINPLVMEREEAEAAAKRAIGKRDIVINEIRKTRNGEHEPMMWVKGNGKWLMMTKGKDKKHLKPRQRVMLYRIMTNIGGNFEIESLGDIRPDVVPRIDPTDKTTKLKPLPSEPAPRSLYAYRASLLDVLTEPLLDTIAVSREMASTYRVPAKDWSLMWIREHREETKSALLHGLIITSENQ